MDLIKKVVSVETEMLWLVFELACDHDLFDVSRYESFYPALKHICEALDEGGFGDRKVSECCCAPTTPRKLLRYITDAGF